MRCGNRLSDSQSPSVARCLYLLDADYISTEICRGCKQDCYLGESVVAYYLCRCMRERGPYEFGSNPMRREWIEEQCEINLENSSR